MSRALSTSDRETWLRTLSFLLLGSVCYALPWSVLAADDNASVLRIQGSNTIGARLGPALVEGLLEEQGQHELAIAVYASISADNPSFYVAEIGRADPS